MCRGMTNVEIWGQPHPIEFGTRINHHSLYIQSLGSPSDDGLYLPPGSLERTRLFLEGDPRLMQTHSINVPTIFHPVQKARENRLTRRISNLQIAKVFDESSAFGKTDTCNVCGNADFLFFQSILCFYKKPFLIEFHLNLNVILPANQITFPLMTRKIMSIKK